MSDSSQSMSPALNILTCAHKSALETRKYNSTATRHSIEDKFQAAFDGKAPYSWQVDVTEALVLGLDCMVIAGTGSGKTMPFVMPLLLDEFKDKIVVVISPLNKLEAEQAARFHKLGLTATAVNADVYTQQLHEEIEKRQHRVLLTSPEMCLKHPRFSKLMRMSEFTQNILTFVVDEAHCISQWGKMFRKKYAELGRLRSYVPDTVPILATSATMPRHILDNVWLKLHLSDSRTFTVNLGNDRPNITPIIARMRGAASDLNALDFAIDEAIDAKSLIRTIIYFNTRDLAYKGLNHLRSIVPDGTRTQIDFVHGGRSKRAKQRVMNNFREGKVNILCATEIAGMGMDIQDVDRVIQYMVLPSLSVWTQHLGRAGRAGQPATVILLVEPSVYKLVKSKSDVEPADQDERDEDEEEEEGEEGESDAGPAGSADPTYQKKVEDGMRKWLEATTCRRIVADVYFNNPRRTIELTVPCCDLCVLKKLGNGDGQLSPAEAKILTLYNRINSRKIPATQENEEKTNHGGERSDEDQGNNTAVPQTNKRTRPSPRRKERLEACRNVLLEWRHRTWHAEFKDCAWGPNILLLDNLLTKFATRARIRTLHNIKEEIPEWIWADEYGEDVLKVLEPIDQSWHEENEQRKLENKAKRAKVSAEKKVIRDQERLAKAREATAQRKASTSRPVLQPLYYPLPGSNHPAATTANNSIPYQPQPIQYLPHPTQYAMTYAPAYPSISFIPYRPPNS